MGTGENERVVVEVGGGKWLGIGFFSFFSPVLLNGQSRWYSH